MHIHTVLYQEDNFLVLFFAVFINYFKKKCCKGHLVSLPIMAFSDTLGFLMSLKIFSSINGAIAIQSIRKRGLKKGLPGKAYNLKIKYKHTYKRQHRGC